MARRRRVCVDIVRGLRVWRRVVAARTARMVYESEAGALGRARDLAQRLHRPVPVLATRGQYHVCGLLADEVADWYAGVPYRIVAMVYPDGEV